MVNNDLSTSAQNQLQVQLHIDETITGQELDLRIAADPNYIHDVRAMRQRVMVMRDFRETANRTEMDVVIFVREAMVYVERNCFGPTGQSFYLAYLHWGQLGIYDTNVNRSCKHEHCGCGGEYGCGAPPSTCGCGIPICCDGYGRAPFYPARFDPKYPHENHPYNQIPSSHVFGNCGCSQSLDRVLCRRYFVSGKTVIPQTDCRQVKQ